MQPGDIIAFSGKGNFSEIIKWATSSEVSHVGIVFESKVLFPDGPQPGYVVDVMESTTLYEHPETGQRVAGVQRNRLSLRVKYYDGVLWWLPLSKKSREKLDLQAFTNFLLHSEGKQYDMPQAIRSALDAMDGISILNLATYNQEDFASFFCSELAAAALEAGGVIKAINASEVTPIDLCSFDLYGRDYYQIKGKRTKISDYNARSPEKFGMQ
jgi:hypothetical protein